MSLPSRQDVKRDSSAKDRNREHRVTPTRNERTQAADVERQVECEPNSLDAVDSGALHLVEAPLDDGIGRRTLDARTNRRCSGCRSDHDRDIGGDRSKL